MSPKAGTKNTTKANSGGVAPDVVKVGNLTRDPELGYGADNGTPYARAGLAVEHPAKGNDWKGELVTDFYEVTSFGSVAEHVAESLHKGDRVVVFGKGEIETWTDKDGAERKTKRILAQEVAPSLRWATVTVHKEKDSKNPRDRRAEDTGDDDDEEPF